MTDRLVHDDQIKPWLEAIRNSPKPYENASVFADWLEEHGDFRHRNVRTVMAFVHPNATLYDPPMTSQQFADTLHMILKPGNSLRMVEFAKLIPGPHPYYVTTRWHVPLA